MDPVLDLRSENLREEQMLWPEETAGRVERGHPSEVSAELGSMLLFISL